MLSHVDSENNPGMVDVSSKKITRRNALAQAVVVLPEEVTALLENGDIKSKKGPVFQTAIIAGTMAVKKTSDLIPFCHPLGLEDCKIRIKITKNELLIECEVAVTGKTGVEMEALTGATVAALTVYDMCKAMSHNIVIKDIRLLEKKGGKSDYRGKP
jgi:cyclic pyranopterin phosphate synthase